MFFGYVDLFQVLFFDLKINFKCVYDVFKKRQVFFLALVISFF